MFFTMAIPFSHNQAQKTSAPMVALTIPLNYDIVNQVTDFQEMKSKGEKMNDFITAVRDEQLKLAERIITTLQRTILFERQRKLRQEIRDEFENVDETALCLLIQHELLRDVLTALIGYTDWLATKLWRNIACITESIFTSHCDDRAQRANHDALRCATRCAR